MSAPRKVCVAHGNAYKSQFGSTVFRCGQGCEQVQPGWHTEDGWAVEPEEKQPTSELQQDLIERVFQLDFWGGRDAGPARRTARRIVDQVILPELAKQTSDEVDRLRRSLDSLQIALEAKDAELERVRAGIRSNTEGCLQDDPDSGNPELFPWELRDLRERLESLLGGA